MVFRTDGTTQYSNHGAYPFVWNYGGSGSTYRRMILHTNGQLWTSNYGWLHDKFFYTGKDINIDNGTDYYPFSINGNAGTWYMGTWSDGDFVVNYNSTSGYKSYMRRSDGSWNNGP